MSSEKRLILFFVVTIVSFWGIQYAMETLGLVPPPAPAKKLQPPVAQAKPKATDVPARNAPPVLEKAGNVADKATPRNKDKDQDKEATPTSKTPIVELASTEELTLGSRKNQGPDGYRIEVQLDQRGAGIASLVSALYEAEYVEGKPKHRPLELLVYDAKSPSSLSMTLVSSRAATVNTDEAVEAGIGAPGGGELPLDGIVWEVVRDPQGKVVQGVSKPAKVSPGAKRKGNEPEKPQNVEGQEVTFRTKVDSLGLTVTKRYRLFKGEDGFELDLSFDSPEKTQGVVYKLLGPHGIPIEGEWYTGTFRDAVFGLIDGSKTTVRTLSAYDIAKRKDNPERFQTLPLRYAGIENQYFAALTEPTHNPVGAGERWDAETAPVILHENPESNQKADIAVVITSRPVQVGPNAPATHAYRVFAGPKTVEALTPYGAEDLAAYRKNDWIPFASYLARGIITPLLAATYDVTRVVSRSFGGQKGNYGIAIILLTMVVRLAMFPLGRKQAIAAKKMQDLQPLLKEIQEKYKEDKEAQTKETWALYKRQGVNPVGGCLPALIQLPIFVGLWQALNNSVHLRHESFLWIQNLAAPDMLFRFPTQIPFLGDYFNVLPFLVVALMLVQTKLFSPPATTPEAEAQQKMMKYMMIFMAFMFYKVPSGLGIYFITSSLWQIGERLLLPKMTKVPASKPQGPNDLGGGGGGNGRGGGNGSGGRPEKPPGRFARFMEKVLAEASKNPTYRKLADEQSRDHGERDGRERDRDRDRPKPRARPGKRR
ncbi:MAG: hypothetical protein NVSMB9_07800 [Isosphaeraceae bacterium]